MTHSHHRTAGVVVLLAAVVGLGGRAHAQTCTPPVGWRAPLTYFCVDRPARASEVNGNFSQVVAWLEAKVGQVGQTLALAPGTVATAALADGAVTTVKLADDAITTAKIGPGAVGTADLANAAVDNTKVKGGGIPVYSVNSSCAASGEITRQTACAFTTANCGTCGIAPRYRACDGSCPSCQTGPSTCTVSNPLLGYLVGP